jgi:hypothetical protein
MSQEDDFYVEMEGGDMVAIGSGILQTIAWHSLGRTEEINEKSKSGQPVLCRCSNSAHPEYKSVALELCHSKVFTDEAIVYYRGFKFCISLQMT